MGDPLEMSLDDYINSFQETGANVSNGFQLLQESKFKEGRREQADSEEGDEEVGVPVAEAADNEYVSLAHKNDELAVLNVGASDLRNKIGGKCPSANSQQWRLMQPNVIQARPAGMPPLVPADINASNLNGSNNWRNYNGKHRIDFGRQNWRNNKNKRYGRIQRFGDNNRPNWNCKNIKTVLEQLKDKNPMILYPNAGTPDLTIEASIHKHDKSFLFKPFQVPALNQQSNKAPRFEAIQAERPASSEAIKSLLGVNEVVLSNDMMPMLAGKLLDFINGVHPVVHKPQYDMRIQKEIHEIQKKPLLYKCPGGEVVSSDGAGIPNCRIQPKTSGVSLNHRFA